eukprot:Gb_11631 [translate_table: standard]
MAAACSSFGSVHRGCWFTVRVPPFIHDLDPQHYNQDISHLRQGFDPSSFICLQESLAVSCSFSFRKSPISQYDLLLNGMDSWEYQMATAWYVTINQRAQAGSKQSTAGNGGGSASTAGFAFKALPVAFSVKKKTSASSTRNLQAVAETNMEKSVSNTEVQDNSGKSGLTSLCAAYDSDSSE